MGHNSHGFYFALTINAPKRLNIPPQDLGQLQNDARHSKIAKRIVNWAYCVEAGKNGDTPHVHALIHYDYDRRTDKVKETLLRYFLKAYHLPCSPGPYFLVLKKAFNPYAWLTKYMKKENPVTFCDDFDHEELKAASLKMTATQQTSIEAYEHKKINRINFYELYQGLLTSHRLDPYPDSDANMLYKDLNAYYTGMTVAFMEMGYQPHFLVYNSKQVIYFMQLASGVNMTIHG